MGKITEPGSKRAEFKDRLRISSIFVFTFSGCNDRDVHSDVFEKRRNGQRSIWLRRLGTGDEESHQGYSIQFSPNSSYRPTTPGKIPPTTRYA